MKRRIAALILVIIIGSFVAIGFYYGYLVVEVHKIQMDIRVSNKVGFNTATDALHFGTVYPGGDSTRRLTVTNNNNFPIIMSIRNRGNISGWVYVDSQNSVIDAHTNKTIIYTVSPGTGAEQGIYKGSSLLTMKRVLW